MTRRDRQAVWFSLTIGVLSTALVLVAYGSGRLDRIELGTYDLRCKYANSIEPDPRLVILAIDDTSLRVIERWPWSRSTQAALISLAAELGAKRIIVDLLWDERERPLRQLTMEEELRFSPQELDGLAAPIGYPDKELAAAIAQSGNVYVSFSYSRQTPESLTRAPEFQAAVDAALANDLATMQRQLDDLSKRRRKSPGLRGEPVPQFVSERARLIALFQKFPVLSAAEAFTDAGIAPSPQLADDYDRFRLEALRRLVREFVQNDKAFAALSWQQQLQQAFRDVTGKPFDPQASIARLLDAALGLVHGEMALDRVCRVATTQPVNALPVEAVHPPYYYLLREAKGAGFVEFQPDAIDGVVRRLPIFARHGARVFPQLSVAAALDELNIPVDQIQCRAGEIAFRVPGRARPIAVQVDEFGEALVPWVPDLVRDDARTPSTRRFASVPMDALWSLLMTRQAIQNNRDDIAEDLRSLLRSERLGDAGRIRAALRRFDDSKVQIRAALLAEAWDHHKSARKDLEAAGAELCGTLPDLATRLNAMAESLNSAGPADAAAIQNLIETGNRALTLDDANQSLASEEAAISTRLRGLLSDKLVFIGYTAAALADAKPIPTAGSAAGVLGHVNLLNGLLTGQLVTRLPNWANLAIAACAGILATFISARMRPRLGLLLIAFLIVAFLAIAGFIAFYRYRMWIALTPGVAALFVPYLLISVYRYVFIDSERRHLATTLGQYTSKQIAKLMAEDPELCRKAESREVTAMFTDLRGFTTISERIGAERTQKVLNICLGRFTEVMLQHEAMVNKFIGDGIFAFWNPVIFPQPDHVLKACETALDLQESLIALQAEMKKRGGDDVFSELQLRIGVATGNAIVGPCGSEQKYDYTCIGDSVNLAARLESANKAFGTLILVAGPARDVVGERFTFRYLGGVQVKGKTTAIPVYELLGRSGSVAADAVAYAGHFAAGVAEYQSRRWSEASMIFQECLRTRPYDLAAQAYLDQTRHHEINHPPEKWNGAIELLEK